ncbi:MAG: ABC transporter ATP-binding protein [Legionellales bacterium]|nr:ABC transporter ATP-binding protein [Legionellales bacterium]
MSNLITLDDISLSFASQPLLDHAQLRIEKGERVCLIGRNGAGKSSLLKLIEGQFQPDHGTIWRAPSLKIARLQQDPPQGIKSSVYEYVSEGLSEVAALLKEYHQIAHDLESDVSDKALKRLSQLQQSIDSCNGWEFDQTVKTVLTRLDLNGDQSVDSLSGGWQRRAALARALVLEPDLLLLDEPTNHLDIEAIDWLEKTLLNLNIGIVFITHDRALLRSLATRIIELDRGQLTSWPGDYDNFLRRKEERLAAEEKENALFDKKLAQEEVWIRQGIKARRTRNEGRVRALKALREKRGERREVQASIKLHQHDIEKSGKLVLEAENIAHGYNGSKLIKNFSTTIMRGDRIGLIGPNGVGKSTLLNILLGEIAPQEGNIKHGSKLTVAYFDQLRAQIDPEQSVIDNVAQGTVEIMINGKPKHAISYLQDFLFTPERARSKAKVLSGGEKNRLLLARLFTKPANVLVMDEPTNDLDIETLELLEELLCDYDGTLLLVSHDRVFLDNIVTSTIVFEGNGHINEYVGGYSDWLRHKPKATVVEKKPSPESIKKSTEIKSASSVKKLNYEERKTLAALPKAIEKLEAQVEVLHTQVGASDFYASDKKHVDETLARLSALEAEVAQKYQEWELLEDRANQE